MAVLFFSISSVSSQSVNDFDNINDTDYLGDKVLKTNSLSSSLSTKETNASTATKAKSNTAKVTNATKKTNATSTKTTNATKKTNATSGKKTNVTTVNKKTLAKTSTSFMNSVEKNGKFPKVKISNKNYSNTEYLYLVSKAVENESNSKIEIKNNLVKPYNNTKIKSVKGTINKTEYVKIAGKTRIFIEKNQRAPNWASSSKGNIPYNQLTLLFSKCLDTYNKTNKLPNSVRLDDLDLDQIKKKIDEKNSKSMTNSSAKANTTKKNTTSSATKATTTKNTTSSATKATTTKNTSNNTTKTASVQNAEDNSAANSTENTEGNISLVEKSMDYVQNILNNILNRLDPSKYKIDVTKTDEANVKVNTSKINVDVSGKSTVNVKISAKNTTSSTKANTSKKNSTNASAKTANNTTKKNTTNNTTAKKTNTTKTSTAKKNTTATSAKTANNTTKKNTTNNTTAKKTNTTNTKKTAKTVSKANSISEALKKYLSSSKNCQVNNKQIKELANALTYCLKSDYEKGKKVFAWVRDNIQYKKYSNTRRGALKTLQSKKGNCVDQAHLLVALSRAAGIPARYVNGGNCKFTSGYVSGHVWAQMYINNKWMVADPTSYRNSLGKIKNWNTKSYTHYGEYSSINF